MILLDNADSIATIAAQTGFAIFQCDLQLPLPDFSSKNSIEVTKREGEASIGVEQIIELFSLVQERHQPDFFVILRGAEQMTENASNAFLKQLEEPGEHIHFVFLTTNLAKILPTIRSRAQCYVLKNLQRADELPAIDAKYLALAKEYITLSPEQLPGFAKKVTKDSKTARATAQATVDAAIHLTYASYFKTGNSTFLNKLERLLAIERRLQNGNVKLQLVAGML